MQVVSTAMIALYLRGVGGRSCSPRRWPLVLGAMRAAAVASREEVADCLREASLEEEAGRIGDSSLWEAARCLTEDDRVLTVAHEAYPSQWRRLGCGAPPALWLEGAPPHPSKYVAIVGTREPSKFLHQAVETSVMQVAQMGYGIVSGGARGVDRLAAQAAQRIGAPLLDILPTIGHIPPGARPCTTTPPGTYLSINPDSLVPGAAAFMERNALIYALGAFALVFDPRFQTGGTWHGAIEAHRRCLTRLLVHESEAPGTQALIALGLTPFKADEGGIARALAKEPIQTRLPAVEPW